MQEYIYLRPNIEPVLLTNVITGTDKIFESLVFKTGELWYDEQGIIRQFSVRYNNFKIGNYFLLPLDKDTNKYTNALVNDFAEFGLTIVSNTVFSGSTIIVNLAKFLFDKYSKIVLKNSGVFESNSELGYIALDNNEIVFKGILNTAMCIKMSSLLFYIHNNANQEVVYQTSRDLINWISSPIASQETKKHYFKNGQNIGYLRILFRNKISKIYKIETPNFYTFFWNEHTLSFELVIKN